MNGLTSVLCYGDSNTYGFEPVTQGRYEKAVRWTTLLGEMLNRDGEKYEVIAEGLNGRTTAYDRRGMAWKNGLKHVLPAIGTHMPIDKMIIMLGTNDVNFDMELEVPEIADGLERLICCVEENTPEMQGFVPEMIIVCPAAVRPELEGTPFADELDQTSVEKSHQLAPLYKEIAEKHGCVFVDATDVVDVSPVDCEHLSVLGHKQLAELLCEVIEL